MTKQPLTIAYSDDYLNWQLGSGDGSHPTKPIRAKIAVEHIADELHPDWVRVIEPTVHPEDREKLESIHSPNYVSDVVDRGVSYDWTGSRPEMGYTAMQMFSGTARLVEEMIAGNTKVAFNPQGAKHHAQYDHSEGFCVFNDFAWAAQEFERNGLRAVYIDWDVNAGDGVQNLLENTDIPTFSIHGSGIYPTHSDTWSPAADKVGISMYEYSDPESHWYNYCIAQGEGDSAFAWAIDEIAEKVAEYQPDVILLATGADGHEGEHWGLKYTYDGYRYAAKRVAELAALYADGRVLIGGAGGYQPFTHTPRIWANVVEDIYIALRK